MFERFKNSFHPVMGGVLPHVQDVVAVAGDFIHGNAELLTLFRELGGTSYNQGIYRILGVDEIDSFADRTISAFPDYAGCFCPFAYDWLDRIYGLAFDRAANSPPQLVMLSHFSDEIFEIPFNLVEFHNEVLVENTEQALELRLFTEFLSIKQRDSISRQEGAGFLLPLFLGGEFTVENLDIVDTNVDWHVTSELLGQTRSMAPGTRVGSITSET